MRRAGNRNEHEHEHVTSPMNGQPGCNGKRVYRCFEVAAKLAKRMRQHSDELVEPYHCRFCGRFHIGGNATKGK